MTVKMKSYHHGDLRKALLRGALEILDEQGIEAVTIRAVAQRAGVGHSAPANHFKDKKALLTQVATNIFIELGSRISGAISAQTVQKTDRFHALAAAVYVYAWTHPHRYRLLWRRDCIDHQRPDYKEAGDTIYSQLKIVMEHETDVAALGAETRVIALWSLVHGYICLRLDGILVSGIDEITGKPREHAIIDALLEGIL